MKWENRPLLFIFALAFFWLACLSAVPQSTGSTVQPSSPETQGLTSSPQSETMPKADLTQSWQELRDLLNAWGSDSEDVYQRLLELQDTVTKLESSLTESKALSESLDSSSRAEAEAYRAKIAELEKRIALLRGELALWQIGAGVAGVVIVALGVAWMLK